MNKYLTDGGCFVAGTDYSMGFALSFDGKHILLLHKNRPDYLAGQLVGVAGHVEEGETPLQAMIREAKEEADIDCTDWNFLGVVAGQTNPEDKIFMFAVRADLSKARTMTDELVEVFSYNDIANLNLALSVHRIKDQLHRFVAENCRSMKKASP